MTGSRVAALLLDLDGTLVDSEPLHRARYRAWFAHRGWPYDDEVAAQFTGRRADDVFRTVDGPWRGRGPRRAARGDRRGSNRTDRLPEPVAGAAEAVAGARAAGIPLALVTSATTRWAGKVLEQFGGIGVFDVTVTRDDIATGKPDPACYALACDRLGVAAGDALACEDAPDGVRSAAGAGVGVVVGVTTSFTAQLLRDAGATRTVPDLTTLPDPAGLVTGVGKHAARPRGRTACSRRSTRWASVRGDHRRRRLVRGIRLGLGAVVVRGALAQLDVREHQHHEEADDHDRRADEEHQVHRLGEAHEERLRDALVEAVEERAVLQHAAGSAAATGLGRLELLGHGGVRRVGQRGLEVGRREPPLAGPR